MIRLFLVSLIFSPSEIINKDKGLTFDDVLIVPSKSSIKSRREPGLSTQATKKLRLKIPLISSNMDTVTEQDMALAMHKAGGLGILHRFITTEKQCQQVEFLKSQNVDYICASIGVKEDEKARAEALVKAGVHSLTIDIAHGHSVIMIEMLEWVKKTFPHIEIIAGNVATPEATKELIEAGADAIKVGIGPGSMCTTRIITGCGVPQLTAIALCSDEARKHGVPVIADGGLRNSGDIVKALVAGAQTVMLGSLLAGSLETPGAIVQGRKKYRGMASKAAQDAWRGGVPEGMAPEGMNTSIAVKGPVQNILSELTGGIRSAMSYINSSELEQVHDKAKLMLISSTAMAESRAHGLSNSNS